MSLQERLQEDLKDAMRAGDRVRLTALRLSIASVHNAQIEKGGALDDADVVRVLQKEAKSHRESIVEFAKGNRHDLVAKEQAELAVVETYLPQKMSREELVVLARSIIEEVGAQGPRDIGKVMPRLMAATRGRAEGKDASEVVQDILANR
jgi:uncharacterized protein